MGEVLTKDQGFKGFETWLTALKMKLKMFLYVGVTFLVVQVLVTCVLSLWWYGHYWGLIFKYTGEGVKAFEFRYIFVFLCPYVEILLKESGRIFIITFGFWILYPFVMWRFTQRAKEQSKDRYVRGARLITEEELAKAIRRDGERTDLPVGSVMMPISAEAKHCFIIGRPGVGKTVAISQIIERLKERRSASGGKGIIYDFKGDYLSRFYDPSTDIIFNPLDQRCLGWSVFNEVSTFMDVDAVAHSLIPPAYTSDPFWNDAARDVFSGILHFLYQNSTKTNRDIWNAVTAPGTDIAGWLRGTKGGERGLRYIEDASSKQAMSVFAVMMQYVKAFEYMATADGGFSIKQWLEDEKSGLVFITNYSDVKDTLRPILSLFVDLVGRKLLSMPDNYDRRIFFMLDEFGTLQRLSTIVQLLTLSRSKGGSCWLGIQDIGQIDKIYTSQLRQSIVNACGSNLVFSVSDPETARFLSEKIGETEYIETEETHSMGTENNRDGIALIRRKKTEKLVLPSDIQNLRDLTAFLKLPNYDVAKVQFIFRKYLDQHTPFIMKKEFHLDSIVSEQNRVFEGTKDRTNNKEISSSKERGMPDRDNRDYSEDIENEII